jgi:hypothetical protein
MSEEEQTNQPQPDPSLEDTSTEALSQEATQEQLAHNARSQPTGDSADIQAQVSEMMPNSSPREESQKGPRWITDLKRYHNDMNGLLAAKENLKLVALDKSVKPSFRYQWSLESNSVMRITVILRRRLATYSK